MKKLLFLLPLSLLLLASCNKEEAALPAVPETEFSILDLDGNRVALEGFSFDETEDNTIAALKSGNNFSANGHYAFGASDITFSAVSNNGGIHGQINMVGSVYDLKAAVECIFVAGNKAMIGGRITEITRGPAFFTVGGYVHLGVIDNGEGANATPDQHLNFLAYNALFPGCATLAGFFFPAPPFIWPNVSQGNQIQVKN